LSRKPKAKTIRIACEGAATLPLDALEPFQGAFKRISEVDIDRLRRVMLTDGFSDPFNVWREDPHNWIIDGHQRRLVLLAMRKDGYEIPELPVVWVEADSIEQAKRKVLSQASQYGEVLSAGLVELMEQAEVDAAALFASFRFPELEVAPWTPKEDGLDLSGGVPTENKCPSCGYAW